MDEPDRWEGEHVGLPLLAIRHPRLGHWCGYVAVPPSHPLHGQDYGAPDIAVHGGFTYANACHGAVCHVPKPGEPDNVWWFGFDCAHAGDYTGMADRRFLHRVLGLGEDAPYDHQRALTADDWSVETYRTLAYVQAECKRVAEQLAR
jgi:hypothetical protein